MNRVELSAPLHSQVNSKSRYELFDCFVVFLPRNAMHKRGLYRHAVSVRLSVRLPVTFAFCVETRKCYQTFPPIDSHTILVFPYQTL